MEKIVVLETFLDRKPLYYKEIDYSRMPRVYASIQSKLKLPKIIHLIGTNGKGTTGRFLASALFSLGCNVGHYTSPHILEFNERVWLNGCNVATSVLEDAHQKLLSLLSKEDADSLSYFEYTTLLAMLVYEDCDYVVLEAGLGGEHDATAVFENILTLVTPIDRDHEAFLGDTITQIATTKLNAIQKNAIVAKQINEDVYNVIEQMVQERNVIIKKQNEYLSADDLEKINQISKRLQLSEYLQENLSLSIAALKFLGFEYRVDDFKEARLFGRLSVLNENILLDVGHNVLAARRIYESLKGKKYILVYNSYKDKSYREILTILEPIIEDIEIIELEDERVESELLMRNTLNELGHEYKKFQKIEEGVDYLVFGSFSVVEAFLRKYNG